MAVSLQGFHGNGFLHIRIRGVVESTGAFCSLRGRHWAVLFRCNKEHSSEGCRAMFFSYKKGCRGRSIRGGLAVGGAQLKLTLQKVLFFFACNEV